MPKIVKRILISLVAIFGLMIHSGLIEKNLLGDPSWHHWQSTPEGVLFRFHWAGVGVAMLALCQWVFRARQKKDSDNDSKTTKRI